MPIISGAICFAWELNALIRSGSWMHFLWIGLDVVILVYAFICLETSKKRLIYVAFLAFMMISLFFIFEHIDNGMLISSFVLDLVISIEFILSIRQLSRKMQIPIAVTKLLGDLAAGIYYGKGSSFVLATAIIVFLLNCLYLDLAVSLYVKSHDLSSKRKARR